MIENFSSVGSFPKWLHQPGLSQFEATVPWCYKSWPMRKTSMVIIFWQVEENLPYSIYLCYSLKSIYVKHTYKHVTNTEICLLIHSSNTQNIKISQTSKDRPGWNQELNMSMAWGWQGLKCLSNHMLSSKAEVRRERNWKQSQNLSPSTPVCIAGVPVGVFNYLAKCLSPESF